MITNTPSRALRVLRAGLYERVSTGSHDSAESRSVERQNQKGRDAVRQNEWRQAARYSDPGLSASRFARKVRQDWLRLLADIRAGRLDVVVLWIPSRGSRELEDWAAFLNACMKHGVRIYITQNNRLYDMTDADDWNFLASKGVESVTESNRTSLLSKDGILDSVSRGDPYGRVPFGYRRWYESSPRAHKGRIIHQEPDEAEAPIVREIITRVSRSDPISRIVADFRDRDIRTRAGTYWSQSSVRRVVSHGVVYIGKRRHNGSPLTDGNWPPLVDEPTYQRALAVLNDPARKAQMDRRGGGIRPGHAKYLLSYIAECDVCGYPLGVTTNRMRKGERVAQYRCANPRASHCYADVQWLDPLITRAVIDVCASPALYRLLTARNDEEAQAARDEAENERARLDAFEQQAIAGDITADSFARIARGIEAKIAELEERARSLSVPPDLRDLLGVPVPGQEVRKRDIRARWGAMSITSKRAVVRALFAPTLKPTGRGGMEDLRRVSPNPRWLPGNDTDVD